MFDLSGTDLWRMRPYQHFGVHFPHDFEVDLKNEAKIEVQNAHMGASVKYRSGTLEINSGHIPLTKTGSLGMRKITAT